MAKSNGHPKPSAGKSKSPAKSRVTTAKLARPRKTPLTRKGMSPERLLKAAGSISTKMLDAMEKAIEEGCGRVESHGQ
jgi:hypothetical protein